MKSHSFVQDSYCTGFMKYRGRQQDEFYKPKRLLHYQLMANQDGTMPLCTIRFNELAKKIVVRPVKKISLDIKV